MVQARLREGLCAICHVPRAVSDTLGLLRSQVIEHSMDCECLFYP